MITKKHRGAWAEMQAVVWLLGRGYEVFRNVSQHGAVDLIAWQPNTGEITKIDVKTACRQGNGRMAPGTAAIAKAREAGVSILYCDTAGDVYWADMNKGAPAEDVPCAGCSKPIVPHGRNKMPRKYCSVACKALVWRAAHPSP